MKTKIIISFFVVLIVLGFLFHKEVRHFYHEKFTDWPDFDVASLPPDSLGNMIRYGRSLVIETSNIIGPEVENITMRFAGNNLQCTNCHFEGGTERNTMSYIGVANRYPAFSKRHNRMSDLTERVQDCMQRSLNGKKLPPDSYELKSFLAYLNWLSEGIPKDLRGVTIADIEFPKREPDVEKGKLIFESKCMTCHAYGGLGVLKNPIIQGGVKYVVPPISGDDSFNDGAGMSTMNRLVKFIKTQMPKSDPGSLSLDEAYDVAGYVSKMKRPVFKGEE